MRGIIIYARRYHVSARLNKQNNTPSPGKISKDFDSLYKAQWYSSLFEQIARGTHPPIFFFLSLKWTLKNIFKCDEICARSDRGFCSAHQQYSTEFLLYAFSFQVFLLPAYGLKKCSQFPLL
jgi:hypothetical protein